MAADAGVVRAPTRVLAEISLPERDDCREQGAQAGHLADRGRAVIVLSNSALFESGRAGRIRQRIIKAGLLDAVLALPPGLFPSTSVASSVLVFVEGRPNVNGKPAPTLMVDIRDATGGRTGRSATLTNSLIYEVAHLYRSWTVGEEPASKIAAVARYDDLATNDFVIDPGRYVSVLTPTRDIAEAVHQRAVLLRQLERLSQVSKDADDELKVILEARQ